MKTGTGAAEVKCVKCVRKSNKNISISLLVSVQALFLEVMFNEFSQQNASISIAGCLYVCIK